ncbi:E3 ubiquitin-protein ligase RNF166-like [Littorina saxatilis]|uniref:RING-type domain-containing protein n=1 Tax=Littorina saxatilis TaxID=31220 RepID=A0AAN9BYD1_9CAEN
MAYNVALETDDLEQFTCAICMEIFVDPTRVACGHGHVFCDGCVRGLQPINNQLLCPQCRNPFNRSHSTPANDIVIIMRSSSGHCKTCGAQMAVPELRKHTETCDEPMSAEYKFRPIKRTSQPVPQPGPNRSTFQCPYCPQANLDCRGMVEHCNTRHLHDRSHVVCPICASMPWGDPGQCSTNYIQHLNTRHKFEYDTYVDYGQDDDAMLRAALEASLQN